MDLKKCSLCFLGTGGSMGVPIIGCKCDVCHSSLSFNKRLRPSALLSIGNKKILIDAGPDFRTQALTHEIDRLDGVIFTHAHHDHTAGIDDLRAYHLYDQGALPCLASKETAEDLQDRYKYIFLGPQLLKKLVSRIEFVILKDQRGAIEFLGETIRYFSYEQAGMGVNGFRFGNLGFVSDIREYPETIYEDLNDVEILIISALRFQTSRLHFSIDEAVDFSRKVGAKQTWLTHISHDVDHEAGSRYLPPNVSMAYDGLSIDFEMD